MKDRREVPVDVMMLEIALEAGHGESEWYLDLESGDVFSTFDDPEMDERIENEPERFLFVEAEQNSGDDFRVMEDFVAGAGGR